MKHPQSGEQGACLAAGALSCRQLLGERLRGGHDHVVRDDLRLPQEGPQRQAWKDVPAQAQSIPLRAWLTRLADAEAWHCLERALHLRCKRVLLVLGELCCMPGPQFAR